MTSSMIKIQHQKKKKKKKKKKIFKKKQKKKKKKKKKKKIFENRTGKLLRLSLSSIKVRAIRLTASLKKTRK